MKRGEIWTSAGGGPYATKPRPVLVLQADLYDETNSITIYGLTSDEADTPFTRPISIPNAHNGLVYPSRVMVDKITTVPRDRLRERIGRASPGDLVKVGWAVAAFLAISP